MTHALAGIRVLDISGTVATSYCSKLFADYGADVVNLESATGFPTRAMPPWLDAGDDRQSAMHAYLHTNKHSVNVDDLSPAAQQSLLAHAHLLLDDGQAPDWARAATCTRLSIGWYGPTGPYAGFTGTDAQCFALNGMLRTIGPVDGPPLIPTGYQAQLVGGVTAFIAAMGEILGRELNGHSGGSHIDVSMLEASLCFTDVGVVAAYNTGLQAHRLGINRFPPTYPLGVFPCRDGWIGLTVLTPSQWHTFCELLEITEHADVPLFQTAIGRLQSVDVLEPVIADRLLTLSAEDLFYRAQHAGVPLARVPTMAELFDVDQFNQRSAFAPAELPGGSVLQVPSVPFRLFTTPPNLGGAVAALGAHTGLYA